MATELARLRSALEGKKVTIGTSSFSNSSITGAHKTVEYLEEDFGIEVDFKGMDGNPLVAGMISGQVQIGQISLSGMADAVSAGADFVAFGADDQKNTFVVAAKDPIDSLEQLRGKPFGMTQNLNQITGQTARKCLEGAGLDIEKDVSLLRLSNTGEVTQAIRSGQVTGGISAIWRLTSLRLQEGDVYNVLCKGWETNPQIGSVWFSTRAFLESNHDLGVALALSSLKSARWAHADRAGWISKATGIVEGLSAEAASIDYQTLVIDLDLWPVNGSLDRSLCESTLKTSFEFGALDRAYTVDELVTFEFQDRALEILGPLASG